MKPASKSARFHSSEFLVFLVFLVSVSVFGNATLVFLVFLVSVSVFAACASETMVLIGFILLDSCFFCCFGACQCFLEMQRC
jgi:hypothetical protein